MSYNRLVNETSPYLLQHKDNPVHWWPWGEAAFAEARRLDRPVLLSVGYAACHWCHVMAHESFEDNETAALMNALYINIKVDREERPDVDALYMNALHELGDRGGWPMTMFLTPYGEPFWGGTYFPKIPGYGRAAFSQVLTEIARIYRDERDKVRNNAEALKAAIRPQLEAYAPLPGISEARLADIAARLASAFDPVHGGLMGAPKFPNSVILAFMWKLGLRNGLRQVTEQVEKALLHISQGGIYDHLGGGFARYSVDERWLVPHFEKMLYDNALLIGVMTEVWKENQDPLMAMRVAETADWLLRKMVTPGGGFASSYDADSEGEEGKFYVWSSDEILNVLGEDDGTYFAKIYGVTRGGNWEGTNILSRLGSLRLLPANDEDHLRDLRAKLFAVRQQRVPPGWDDKVLADWNGLAISALARAADAFGQPAWLAAAQAAYAFVKEQMTKDGRLMHSYRAGQAKTPGLATDYANMIAAALDLFQITGDPTKLDDARAWEAVMHQHYWAEPAGYYLSADDTRDIILRTLSASDDATPNANAIMFSNLTALHQITGDAQYREHAEAMHARLTGLALRRATQHTGIFSAAADHLAPQHIVLIRGANEDAMRDALKRVSLPGAVIQWLEPGDALTPASPAHGKHAKDGKATAYICIGPQCSPPITDAEELASALRASRKTASGS